MMLSGTEFGAWATAATLIVTTLGAQWKTSRELKNQRTELSDKRAEAEAMAQRPDVDMARQAFEAMKNLADSYEEEIRRRDVRDKERDERERQLIDEMGRLRIEIFGLKTLLSTHGITYPGPT